MAEQPFSLRVAAPPTQHRLASQNRAVQHGQVRTEADLLVAALQDHVRDLQRERAMLRNDVERLRAELAHADAVSVWGRMKPVRGARD